MFLNSFIRIFTFTNIILIYLEKLYTLALGINPGAVFLKFAFCLLCRDMLVLLSSPAQFI